MSVGEIRDRQPRIRIAHAGWPAHAQDELAEIARDTDEGLSKSAYEPTPAELGGIDRGLRDAAAGRFATDAQVEAALAKLRGA